MSSAVENALFQWEEGYRKLQEARRDPAAYRALGRVVVAMQGELRKRLGSSFSVAELAALYQAGTDWCLDVAVATLPAKEPLPDASAAADAAFYLYMREASDFAGGQVKTT